MKVGLKDIAAKADVSVMTVSRALNNAKGVSESMRKNILQIAEEMGYIQNKLASNLNKGKTQTIGVIVPDIEHTIFPSMLNGIEQVLTAENYAMLLACSHGNPGNEYQAVSSLLEHRVDGIIISPCFTHESMTAIKKIEQSGCPFVFMDRLIPDVDTDSVITDDYHGAYDATMHLIQEGYQHIAHIGGSADSWIARERLRGYCDAMEQSGREIIETHIIKNTRNGVEDGVLSMSRLLDGPISPDAVFCVNDPVAIGAFKTIRQRGMSIPEDVALVGFSSTLHSEILEVPLTTVHQDGSAIGQQAASMLFARIHGYRAHDKGTRQVLKTHLLIRKSSINLRK